MSSTYIRIGDEKAVIGSDAREVLERVYHTLVEIDGCFEAALCEGFSEAMGEGEIERIRDLFDRRIAHARYAAIREIDALKEG